MRDQSALLRRFTLIVERLHWSGSLSTLYIPTSKVVVRLQ
jgi:hypothetical protein